MSSKLVLVEIETGNEAMETSWQVAEALHNIADRIEHFNAIDCDKEVSFPIVDGNGNTVGKVKIV